MCRETALGKGLGESLDQSRMMSALSSHVNLYSTNGGSIGLHKMSVDIGVQYKTLEPQINSTYYEPRSTVPGRTVVGVVIPFFNEASNELQRTLESLHDQEVECADLNVEFQIMVIMDGILNADPSMVRFVENMYGSRSWSKSMIESQGEGYVTVLQGSRDEDDEHTSGPGLVEIAPGKRLRVTCLVKSANMRKTNSHQWFFKTFVPEYNVEYAFSTDCGTLYAQGCLYYLISYLNRHPECSAVTGRQRVMSSDMQQLKTEGLIEMWFRGAQAYDYEASISSFQGAFSLLGMLPVLPGPCGLYRISDVGGAAMDYYMEYIKNVTPASGLIMGNLMLAEDRILSYASALSTGKYTRWVPNSVFYFEAETDSEKLLGQRRRWINGTFACYIYLLFASPKILINSPHSLFFKIMVYSQLFVQMLMYLFSAFSPAIFISLVYFSIDLLDIGSDTSSSVALAVSGGQLALYVIFSVTHYFVKFNRSLFNLSLCINTVTFMFVIAMTIVTFLNNDVFAIALLMMSTLFPFFLALLHSLDVFLMMVFNFVQFFLFLPTFIPWFAAYAFSRTWDLSWGNRPSGEQQQIETERKLKIKAACLLAFLVCTNVLIYGFFVGENNLDNVVYLSVAIICVPLAQQLLSFIFYVFYTEHMMTSSLNLVNRNFMKLLSVFLFIVTIVLLYTGTFTTAWLTNTLEVYTRHNETVLLNTTVAQYSEESLIDLNKTISTVEGDLLVVEVHHYVHESTETKSSLYLLDPMKDLSNNFNFKDYKVAAYYVNSSVTYLTTTNYTSDANGTLYPVTEPVVITRFTKYYNLTYVDTYGNVEYDVGPPIDDAYKADYTFLKTANLTMDRYYIDLEHEKYEGTVDVEYGLLFIKTHYSTITPWKSETTSWGSSLLWNHPNHIWTFSALLLLICTVFLGLIVLIIVYSLWVRDKSRVYSIMVVYTWFTVCCLLLAILLFPMSWAHLSTYHIGWWNPESESASYMCGMDTGYYNPGDCSIGWSYILVIVSFMTGVFCYNSIRFTLNKPDTHESTTGKLRRFLFPKKMTKKTEQDWAAYESIAV